VDRFAALSGDFSPLHVDDEFARRRGFSGRVVHGVLLASYVSMALGMRLPGQDCLIHSLSCHFVAPTYIGDALRLTLVVDQVSHGTRTAVVKFHMDKGAPESVVMRGKAQIGFTGA
jgi:3-hydroxybutyryl-CoA dehydratase